MVLIVRCGTSKGIGEQVAPTTRGVVSLLLAITSATRTGAKLADIGRLCQRFTAHVFSARGAVVIGARPSTARGRRVRVDHSARPEWSLQGPCSDHWGPASHFLHSLRALIRSARQAAPQARAGPSIAIHRTFGDARRAKAQMATFRHLVNLAAPRRFT